MAAHTSARSRPLPRGAPAPPIREGFRFGRFALDIRARELRKDGTRIRLQDQPFDVLLMLLQHPGEVLTREVLRGQLWPEGTFVDFEHGLNAAVKRLRAAIGDRADEPRFIETLHRHGYRFIAPVERIAPEADTHPVLAYVRRAPHGARPRLAILPFTDLASQGGDKYFSEGLAEEMIAQVGRLCSDRLAVVAKGSSIVAHRSAANTRSIGELLNADYLVQGSVRHDGNRVRIGVQLVDARSETQVWAETYERPLADCFLVQAEVATRIARTLSVELLPDSSRERHVGTQDSAAHQAYLKGRYHWNKAGSEGLVQAVEYFEQAVALDPQFTAAYASLARAQVAVADYYVHAPRGALQAARAAAAKAVELDRTDSDAHVALAEIERTLEWNWSAAEEGYRLALSFNPSNEAAHRLYGLFLASRKRTEEAALAAEHACELDPLCLVANTSAASVRFFRSDYEGTIERCCHTLDMDSDFAPACRLLAAALFQSGRKAEAIERLETLVARAADAVSAAWLTHMLGSAGETRRAQEVLAKLESGSEHEYISQYHLALAHVGIGTTDDALKALDRACDARDPALVHLAVEPRFEPLRSDARFHSLIARLGLPSSELPQHGH